MSLENILSKIERDAEAQAAGVLAEGKVKADEILRRARHLAELEAKKLLAQAATEAEEHKSRQLTMAKLDARKSILAAKQDLISKAFTLALDEIRALPVEAAQELLRPLILEAVTEGDETLVCAREDQNIFSASFMAGINAELRSRGLIGKLAVSDEHRQTGGGFFLVGPYIEINATFPARLQALRGDLEPVVAGLLFK